MYSPHAVHATRDGPAVPDPEIARERPHTGHASSPAGTGALHRGHGTTPVVMGSPHRGHRRASLGTGAPHTGHETVGCAGAARASTIRAASPTSRPSIAASSAREAARRAARL